MKDVIEVVQAWGDCVIAHEHFRRPSEITLGPRGHFFVPPEDLPCAPFVLVRRGEDDEYVIADQTHFGHFTFFVRRVDPAEKVPLQFFRRQDWSYLSVLALVLLMMLTGTVGAISLGAFSSRQQTGPDFHIARIIAAPIVVEQPKKKAPAGHKPPAGDAGKIGRREAKRERARGVPVSGRDAGLFVFMRNVDLEGVLGIAGLDDALGDIHGPESADQNGVEGFASRGDGDGGGGDTLLIGPTGPGERRGPGGDGNDIVKGEADIELDDPDVLVVGYDPGLIAQVIKRHEARLRYCYTKELRGDPTLYGKVVVKFAFGKSGHVRSAKVKRSTLGSRAAEDCLAETIRSLRFPPPEGTVIVNYPLLFKSAG